MDGGGCLFGCSIWEWMHSNCKLMTMKNKRWIMVAGEVTHNPEMTWEPKKRVVGTSRYLAGLVEEISCITGKIKF